MTPELNQLFEERHYCVQFGFPTDKIEDRIRVHPDFHGWDQFFDRMFTKWFDVLLRHHSYIIGSIRNNLLYMLDLIIINYKIRGYADAIYIPVGYSSDYITIFYDLHDYRDEIQTISIGWVNNEYVTWYYKKDADTFIQQFISEFPELEYDIKDFMEKIQDLIQDDT